MPRPKSSRAPAETPPLSVVIPVHNALPYLDDAIESVLNQTFSDFELVILDDASTDGSGERLDYWKSRDQRVRLLTVAENLGPARSSNMVAQAARAPIVARMDADDISLPTRLAEELELLRTRPEIGLVASVCEVIDGAGRKIRDPELWRMSRPSVFVPFAHGTIMYRRDLFDGVGGYRAACEFWEDQDLVVRMQAVSGVAIIPHVLYRYRCSPRSTRVGSAAERVENAIDLMYRASDRLAQNRDYEDLLNASVRRHRVDPRVFRALGAVHLWAGGKPRLFRRLLRRGKLTADVRSGVALVWTAWASASPGTLRRLMQMALKLRSEAAPPDLAIDRPIEWTPFKGDSPLRHRLPASQVRQLPLRRKPASPD